MYQHSFDVEIAEKFHDANVAVVFSNLCYWIARNKASRKHRYNVLRDGKIEARYFTYNSVQAFREIFFYLTESQIRLCLSKLVKAGIVIKTKLRKNCYDKTMWYCLSDEDYWVNKYYKYNSGEKDPRPGDGMEDDDEALFDDEGEAVIRGANKGGIVCEIAQIEKSEEEKHDARNSKSICDSTQIDLSENTNVRTDINTYINTSSESEKPDFVEKEEEEALNKKEAEEGAEIELKEALLRLSASFVFSPDFYGKALSFMREKGVNNRYLSWIYEQCVKAKPRSIRNYFYKSFFLPDFLELYLSARRRETALAVKRAAKKICPVCGSEYDFECAECGYDGRAGEIDKLKRLYSLSAEKKKEYRDRRDALMPRYKKGEIDWKTFVLLNKKLDIEFLLEE